VSPVKQSTCPRQPGVLARKPATWKGGLGRICQVFVAFGVLGCSPCTCGAVSEGDPAQPIQLVLTAAVVDSNGRAIYPPVIDGRPLALVRGGQGFHMIAMNVQATNLDVCGCVVAGQLYGLDGGLEVENQIQTSLTDDGAHLAVISGGLGSVVTLPPAQTGYGRWWMNGSVTDGKGRTIDAGVSFIMSCQPGDTNCACFELNPPDPSCDGGMP
jgi:hypothetical protein